MMKKKSKKSVSVKKEIGKDVETVDKQVTKSKKRSSTTENSAPIKKKAKIEITKTKTKNDKPQKPLHTTTEVKSYKQEAEEAKEKKRLRKMKEKKFYEVREEIKKLWEELRKMDLESSKRVKVTNEMYKMVEGKAVHLVFAHDTSRCIQSLVKFGSLQQRDHIFKELKGSFLKMMKSKFAKFCVRKFIKYGSKSHREEIFKVFQGNVAVLLKHKEASDIVELAYNDYANVQHRNCMEQEFYGPVYLVSKTDSVKGLLSFKKEYPDKMAAVVQHMKEKLLSLIEKSILQLSFVHKLLFDFFQVADDASLSELIEALKEHTAHLVHTKNGSRVAMRCLWFGTAKERKAIVKSVKGLVLKMAQEEHGYLVLLAMFDCVDDTRLVCKAIIDEFVKSLDEVVVNQYSRKVLLYLLAPRNPMFFHPDIISILTIGDHNTHSKKDTGIRRKELLSHVSVPLLHWLTPNVKKLTTDNNLLLLLSAIVNNAIGDSTDLMREVASMVAEPFPSSGFHFIDDASGHLVLKKMIARDDDPDDKENNNKSFAEVLMAVVDGDNVRSWIHCNRGCFVIVSLLERNKDEVTKKINGYLQNCKGTLKKLDTKGAQILLKKLS